MRDQSSATPAPRAPLSPSWAGLGWGLLGVTAFSFTVPLTRIAVEGAGMSPLFVGSGRAVVAAVLAAAALGLTRQRLPRGRQWFRLAVVAGGVVVGFPVLTSFALTSVPASQGAVVIALLPAATAVLAVLRGGERPPRAFWVVAVAGAAVTVLFTATRGGGFDGPNWADLLLLGAVVAGGIGYAEGGLLARELGAWQTISWALVVAAPLMVAFTGLSIARQPLTGDAAGWAAFAYLSLVSMFLGFFAWYRGLAIGPMSSVSQVQLVQPVLSVAWAAVLLGEVLGWRTALAGAAVIACAGLAVRVRSRPGPEPTGPAVVAERGVPEPASRSRRRG
ncbi:DMT family transporter [Actinoalloteichus caeruleus]|uniref:DMT family transporter n=1 Tax=Actinoalloteichus cyanogriseus TaxID=2893586 RepID=UPI003AAF204C